MVKSRIAKFYRYLKYSFSGRRLVTIQDKSGINWEIDPRNALDAHLARTNEYSDYLLRNIETFRNLDGIALDIGANSGYWTLPLAENFAQVIALEPDPENFIKLERNVSLNPAIGQKVKILPVGASSETGFLKFNIRRSIDGDSQMNTGLSSFAVEENATDALTVKVTTIDDLLEGDLKRDVSFIKLDVEGYEFQVLQGAVDTINRYRPIIHWEAAFALDAITRLDNVGACLGLLNDLGYSHHAVTNDGELELVKTLEDLLSYGYDVNVLSRSET